MLDNQKTEFFELMKATQEVYDKPPPTKDAMRIWWNVLELVSIESVRSALAEFIKTSKFPPRKTAAGTAAAAAAKKAAGKTTAKTAAKKTPAKKAAVKKEKAPRAGNLTPSAALQAVIGQGLVSRPEVTKKLWDYIKAQGLQDAANKRAINADAKLKEVFGKAQVTMFELAGLIGKHLK